MSREDLRYNSARKRTSGFKTPLRVESIDAVRWEILEDFVWQGSQGDQFVVEAGRTTDFATVPWWTQSLIPRTGTWTKAAVLHDKMCDELNAYHKGVAGYPAAAQLPSRPTFGPIDTDMVFRKNARDEGTGAIRSELLWLGVRYGALVNPARRPGWFAWSQCLRVLLDTLLVILAVAVVLGAISWAWPW